MSDEVPTKQPAERNAADIAAVFAKIDRLGGAEFLPEGRPPQPPLPPDPQGTSRKHP